MFNNRPFHEVNREERHFGFLLFSEIIHNSEFRSFIFDKINNYLKSEKYLNEDNYDIFSEVALFRDYWYDLGKYKKYDQELHNKRKAVISELLLKFNVSDEIIDKYGVFWSANIGTSKLWYPGKWAIALLKEIQDTEHISENKLLRIRWAYNAKPDFLITSGSNAVFIELKVESGIGDNSEGYNQVETQNDILSLVKMTIPFFKDFTLNRILISDKDTEVIKWSELISKIPTNSLARKHLDNLTKRK